MTRLPQLLRLALRRRRLRALAFASIGGLALTILAFAVCWVALPYPPQRLAPPPAASFIYDRDAALLRAFVASDDAWRVPVTLGDVSPWLRQAVVAVEDGRFYRHPGVDLLAVVRAACGNLWQWRPASGASTITMQLQRLLAPAPRTLQTKLAESFRALQMERLIGKDEILERYLNLAPFGGNACGAEAAALRYFNKASRDLTLPEAALLAGLPQSPARLRPDRHPDRSARRRDHVLHRMRECGMITPEQEASARTEPIRLTPPPTLRSADHFCDFVQRRLPGQGRIRTTLDRRIQTVSGEILAARLPSAGDADGTGAAVVVIDNDHAAVRAMIGGIDSADPLVGRVNAAASPRSAGSLLKPFIYALAFEDGTITPATILRDEPLAVAGYVPGNFDHQFLGPLPAEQALALSRNVPAVRLLQQVGPERVLCLLRDCEITTLQRPASYYGLSLAVGTAEVTLLQIAHAYTVLAGLGVFRPLRFTEDARLDPPRRILSPEACYLVIECLSDPDRTRSVCPALAPDSTRRIAWKTGTSNGHRDGWCVAFGPQYTVAVWLGDPIGRPSPEYLGINAAEIALSISAAISGQSCDRWYAPPDALHRRRVCAQSGLPPGNHCTRFTEDWYIPSARQSPPCTTHPEPPSFPMTVAQPACPIEILSPSPNAAIDLPPGPPADHRIALKAHVPDDATLYWFVDSQAVGTSKPGEPIFCSPRPGRHEIICTDTTGRSRHLTISIRGSR